MAEIKTGVFAKNVQKRLNRAQEKVLQKLGKADETKDEQFEQVVVNFRRQESEGSRLQREMKAYMSAIKAMQQVSINLTQSLHEVYEPDWHGKDDVMVIGKDCDAMWEDFHNKLVDSLLLNLDEYLLQFPDLKTRVAKRSRKLIDYDSARHHMETLQMSGMKNDRKMMKVSPCVVKRGEVGDQVLYQLDGVHGLKPTCCFLKAEEELKKAQKVFDELDVGLQDELPTLWDSRVGFYISTYKSVTNLEAKFHREISLVCRQLYEVMTQLAEQHSDKMFTIQGAPSDSGPLRLARTPSPPEDESSPESPEATSNHMLHPASPGPPRPKSPIQLKKGPPMPPPPKATPTKEVAEEQIIDLFGGDFLPAPSPSQPNERPGESLLDLDFDAFQPQESVSPIPQTAVPWDMWSDSTAPSFFADFNKMKEVPADLTDASEVSVTEVAAEKENPSSPPAVEEPPGGGAGSEVEDFAASSGGEEDAAESSGSLKEDKFDVSIPPADEDKASSAEAAPSEKMPIPSVVIEPASSNEGDDDRDADIISPTAISDNGVAAESQTIKHMSPSGGVSGLPDDFLYKVETMHDFEAANSDELELNRGDVVLVVPTASVEDQEAGWLTGFKESEWLTLGAGAHKGLFPDNFTQRLE
ncbi:amphiphysin isoform X16 [Pseudoliparis swirei]|uniref:amphiphysin isoform X16 n=1 Tax=Pseudoliparis swirei TaxID=2059687 RepID=UPI0024BE5324|nr:amphiphysin isoform X16 [Pseudoliparis swirei]